MDGWEDRMQSVGGWTIDSLDGWGDRTESMGEWIVWMDGWMDGIKALTPSFTTGTLATGKYARDLICQSSVTHSCCPWCSCVTLNYIVIENGLAVL
ncbi:hypothetical protein QQF64_017905 [Cirrhinus molitorella]|uniref:Uncharacterized protein n=1 Tax=Cirrhinus molitorella TaxID=172907 RepID=A0ABR3LNK9_9TELE